MAKVTLISWQEIPSMVEVKEGRKRAKLQLSEPFQELIDLIAMKRGLDGSDAYLQEWRRAPLPDEEGAPDEVATRVAKEFEARFEEFKTEALARC